MKESKTNKKLACVSSDSANNNQKNNRCLPNQGRCVFICVVNTRHGDTVCADVRGQNLPKLGPLCVREHSVRLILLEDSLKNLLVANVLETSLRFNLRCVCGAKLNRAGPLINLARATFASHQSEKHTTPKSWAVKGASKRGLAFNLQWPEIFRDDLRVWDKLGVCCVLGGGVELPSRRLHT